MSDHFIVGIPVVQLDGERPCVVIERSVSSLVRANV